MAGSPEEFVTWCYRTILGREPDPGGLAHYAGRIEAGLPEIELVQILADSDEGRRAGDALRLALKHVPPGHFYSPIPPEDEVERFLARPANGLAGVDLRRDHQWALVRDLEQYYASLPWQAGPTEGLRYHYENPAYSYADAIVLASMLRHLRPSRFIEVGCGWSSCVTLDVNERFLDGAMRCTFVEPFPDTFLALLRDDERDAIDLRRVGLQDAPLDWFAELGAGDVLFIDSTHVSRFGSDVNHLFFDVLPSLAPGVVVHIHDIAFPFEYPADWLREGRAWNEAYVLHAFLQYNDAFDIELFGHQLMAEEPDWFAEHLPLALKDRGGSIWLRRR